MTDFSALALWARDLVRSGHLVNAEIVIERAGETLLSCRHGFMDLERQRPLAEDAIYRIYSMTKPVICVAIMKLLEEGKLKTSDPVHAFIPSFSDQHVIDAGGDREPVARAMTVHDLLTHTAGLTYGGSSHPSVSTSYQEKGIDFSLAYGNLAQMTDLVGSCDLFCQPGSQWIYSVANDVLGRIIEVASGMTLDRYLDDRIFAPLGMKDTAFHVPDAKTRRFVANFGVDAAGAFKDISSQSADRFCGQGTLLSGGGGLVSTRDDYMAFCRMLLARGAFGKTRLLEAETVEQMTRNHLPGDLPAMGCPVHSTMDMSGIGFGYGVAVMVDPDRATVRGSKGDYGWGGVANTYFWIDPAENMIVLFLSQLMPASDRPVRAALRQKVYDILR